MWYTSNMAKFRLLPPCSETKICIFCHFYPPQTRLKPAQGNSPGSQGTKVGLKTRIPPGATRRCLF